MDGKGKRALVTGGSGFVGSNLTRRLIEERWEANVIIRPGCNLDLLDKIRDRINILPHDGSSEHMFRIVESSRPDIVFHLASLFLAQHRVADIEPLIQSNVIFATQLIDAMVGNGRYCLVNTGTSWQHFNNKDYSPVCLYAATKQAFESILQYYIEATPLRAITLKLFDTYGPRDPRPKLFRVLESASKQRKPIQMSPGDQKLDLVYIDDVVEAFVVAARRLIYGTGEAGGHEVFAVSSGETVCLKDLVRLYERTIGRELAVEWGGRPYRPREVMVPWTCGARLPGWTPAVPLDEGLRRMMVAVKEAR